MRCGFLQVVGLRALPSTWQRPTAPRQGGRFGIGTWRSARPLTRRGSPSGGRRDSTKIHQCPPRCSGRAIAETCRGAGRRAPAVGSTGPVPDRGAQCRGAGQHSAGQHRTRTCSLAISRPLFRTIPADPGRAADQARGSGQLRSFPTRVHCFLRVKHVDDHPPAVSIACGVAVVISCMTVCVRTL